MPTAEELEEVRAAFDTFDKNGDGFVTADELASCMKDLGETLDDEEIEEMIAEADMNGDGKINLEEFKKMMSDETKPQEATSEVQEHNLLGINHAGAIEALKLISFPFTDPSDGTVYEGSYTRPESLQWVTDMCGEKLVGYDVAQAVKIYQRANDGTEYSMCQTFQQRSSDNVKKATKFVSHLQMEAVEETLEAMCTEKDKDTIFWLDYFTLCQCKNDFNVERVVKIIEEIGETLVILNLVDGELPYAKRIFCIFEIYATLKGKAKMTVFSRTPNEVLGVIHGGSIDAKNAEARNAKDKTKISKFIDEMDGGFEALNQEFQAAVQNACGELVEAFASFDKDGDGYINADDLRATMDSLGESLTEEEIVEMIKQADNDDNGKLNYAEFARMMVT